ncbi:hypothetical protein C0J45_3567 [Silurus meridionalis]|uniref:Endonuclease/exonuclease/phosphatase domain-containing protein n=1 Tax=Silurus meridionalis TaxID=175797 RepID=A0A8T0BS17_SILME|nr:hypothetical protein HF521_017263 [Silurus meridionalis]KAI5105870.1 hypothetical protein C0J45_3567 [Silurus meridionalis]
MRDNGVLVVGGDFNTYLNKDIDCDPPRQNTSPLKAVLDRFTSSLEIEDTWSYRHGNNLDNWRFTCKQRQSYSRIDMFFMRKDTMNNELSIRVHTETISDHYPLVLQLQMQTKQPKTSKMPQSKQDNPNSNRTTQNNPDNTTEKISVAEILCALKSLTSKTHGCQTSSKTVFTLNSTEYIRLKNTYNDILKTNTLPANFTKVEKNIFSSVITKRLELYGISLKQTLNVLPTKTKYNRSYLEKMAEDLDRKYKDKGLKLYAFAPKINVKILNCFKD